MEPQPTPTPESENRPVLSLRTISPPVLVRIMDVLKELVADTNIIFSPKGMVISVMDANKVAYAYVNLPSDHFEQYRCEGTHMLGVNNAHFHKLIKNCTNRDELMLQYHPSKPELVITVENTAKKYRSTSRLKLLLIEGEILEMPLEKSFCTMVEMNASDLLKICREMSSISDEIGIVSDPTTPSVTFRTEGDMGSVDHTLLNSDSHSVKCPEAQVVNEVFAMRYISTVAKTAALSQRVEIYLEPAFPVLFKFTIGERGIMAFCIAPKLTNHRPIPT